MISATLVFVQVGACIVDASGRVVGTGYNGLPDACSDDDFPWTKEDCNPDSEMKQVYGKLIPAISILPVSVQYILRCSCPCSLPC